ncbi:MAG: glycosyltransferase family 4 protein [Patescibacteria group bacterium]|jgi:glycosyltransferase involved in cell wall biosynthesis
MKELKDTSILMISMDIGLLEASGSGDVIARHQQYAKHLKKLDIIVFGKSNKTENKLAVNFQVYGVGKNIFSFFKAKSLATKLYQKNNYDLIDTQDPHWTGLLGLTLKKKFKTKLEIHFHGDFWQNNIWLNESWKNKFYNFLQSKIVPQVDAIRVVNPRIKEKLITANIYAKKIKVINTPVNEEEFIRAVAEKDILAIKNQYNKKIIFFAGRLVAAKNLIFLLEVVKLLYRKRNDFVLLVAGKGDEQENLVNFVNNNNLEEVVFLLGPQKHQDLVTYFKAAYIHVLLSTNESFGKTIIEAGMTGLATLASKTLGASFIIKDNSTGWLVDINDLDNTVTKLNNLLDSPDEVIQVGNRAKQDFVEHHGQTKTFQKVNDFWQEIINDQL